MKLTEDTNFDQIVFWGKIEGIKKDYYIATGLNFKGCYEFPIKTFYWCSGADFNFAKFTEVKTEYKNEVDKFRGMFVGQPDKILIQAKAEEAQEDAPAPEEDAEEKVEDPLVSESSVEVKPPPQNFLELDRLVYTVRAIEVDCQTVPIGAFKMTPSHEMRYDDEFKGLSIKDANNLKFYQHFRNPVSVEKQEMMSKPRALTPSDRGRLLQVRLPRRRQQRQAHRLLVPAVRPIQHQSTPFCLPSPPGDPEEPPLARLCQLSPS